MKALLAGISLVTMSELALAMSFKAEIQPLKLPVLLSSSQPPKVKYTPPGEISVGLMRMCGDGDVAHFSSVHTDFEFVPHNVKELNVIMGYWVVEDGADPLPSPENFYPVGYTTAPIAEKMATVTYSGDFLPMNRSFSPGPNGLHLIATELINLQLIASRSFEAKKNYRVYAGTFTCVAPEGKEALAKPGNNYKYNPSPVEIGHVLSSQQTTGLYGRLMNAIQDLDPASEKDIEKFISKNDHIKYSPDKSETIYKSTTYEAGSQAPIKFEVGSKGQVKISEIEKLWDVFKEVLALKYPDFSELPETATDSDKREAYIKSLKDSSVAAKLTAVPSADSSFCKNMDLTVNSESPQYKWEIFPMNLACKFLLNEGELKSSYQALFTPENLPKPEEFSKLKRDLAARFYVASAYQAVQKAMHDDSAIKIERPNCFNVAGKPMINRLIGSYPFQFQYHPGEQSYKIAATYNHIHPEPLFALIDYKRYFDSDVTGIWGQVLTPDQATTVKPEAWGILLPLKENKIEEHKIDSSTFSSSPINILFKIRSVGGSCPMFC